MPHTVKSIVDGAKPRMKPPVRYWVVGFSHIGWVFYTSSSVHTGGPSSKACTRVDVVQKRLLQLCCFHSVHRVSAHDAACLYGVVVSVEQRPHWRCHVCCMLCLTPGNTRYDTTQCQGRPPFLALFVYVPWLNRKPSRAACLVHNALIGK